jgi:hypothetical protein
MGTGELRGGVLLIGVSQACKSAKTNKRKHKKIYFC